MSEKTAMYRVSVKGLIRNDKGELFLGKHPNGKRGIPGGGVEHGESPREAMKREIEEELGVTPTSISPFPVRFHNYHRPHAIKYPRVANMYYEVDVHDQHIILEEEGYIDFEYFSLEALRNVDTGVDMTELFESL